MKDKLFQPLAVSLKEGEPILRGKKKADRSTTFILPDLSGQSHATPDLSGHSHAMTDTKAVREKPDLSQIQFAALIGISPRTSQNWEQSRKGTAHARYSASPRPIPRRAVLEGGERFPR